MKLSTFFFISLLTLIGCNKSEDVVSLPEDEIKKNILSITYGTEKSIAGLYTFSEFVNQDSINLNELTETENITLKISESDMPDIKDFDVSKVSVRGITTSEMEVIRSGGKARIRSIGMGLPGFYEFVIPVSVNQLPVKDNNILDLPDINNSMLFIMYSSPWSKNSIVDTLYLIR